MTLIEDTRVRLGTIGARLPSAPLDPPPDVERAATRRLADAGYRSVRSDEGPGTREVFARFGDLPGTVPDVVLGTGIANTWLRRPLDRTRGHLSEMDTAAAENPPPVPFPRVLATVGPKMPGPARDHADGAHPFAQPVSHTPYARESVRRRVAQSREHSATGYLAGRKRLGHTDADITGPSDRFVDDLVLRGDAPAIAKRVGEVLDAGADHVLPTPSAPSSESTVEILLDLAVEVPR